MQTPRPAGRSPRLGWPRGRARSSQGQCEIRTSRSLSRARPGSVDLALPRLHEAGCDARHQLPLSRAGRRVSRPLRGVFPAPTVADRRAFIEGFPDLTPERKQEMIEEYSHRAREAKTWTYANCWNLSENESAALWDLYVSPLGGVAIRTTYGRLVDSVIPPTEQEWRESESGVKCLHAFSVQAPEL